MWLVTRLATAEAAILLTAASGATITQAERREVAYLMLATLAALVTLVIFILGIFIVKRMGARLRSLRVGGEPTTYVDSWSQYRVSDDEIKAATAEDESNLSRDDERRSDNDTPDGDTR